MSAIPLADAPALRGPAKRTFAVRAALAALCLGAAVAVIVARAASAHHARSFRCRRTRTRSSCSTSRRASRPTRSRASAARSRRSRRAAAHLGLVVFSDQAYEAFPPGTPAADLAPFVRYFTLPQQKTPGFLPTFPDNPWQVDLHRRHEDLGRARSRAPDRARGRQARDGRARQRPRRRSRATCRGSPRFCSRIGATRCRCESSRSIRRPPTSRSSRAC